MSNQSTKYISVFVPTYNGDKYIEELIHAVLKQRLPKNYNLEFIIIDSGSTDKTRSIIKKYLSKLVYLEIPNEEFGHGKTRQKAALLAKGEYILFLSQDATPCNEDWLINMIEPFKISAKVGCVFGRQVPRHYAPPAIKREVSGVFGAICGPDSIVLHRYRSLVDNMLLNQPNTFFSDVNSCIRKDLVRDIPFRDLKYAEDQALAQDVQDKGLLKAYTPIGVVWHSNEYTSKEYYHRKFDEYIGLQESVEEKIMPSEKSLLLGWIKPTIADWKFIFRDREYGPRTKVKYFVTSPFYNFALQLGKYHAAKYINDSKKRSRLSLEEKGK